MKSGLEYYSEDLTRSAEKILLEIEDFLSKKSPGIKTAEPEREEPEGGQVLPGPGADARAEIKIQEDSMKALMDLYPPKGEGRMLTIEKVRDVMSKSGVVFGVDEEIVEEAVLVCCTGKKHVADIPIACGRPPEEEVPAHIETLPRFTGKEPALSLSILRVDYREKTPFIFVKKDETLAREVAGVPGKPGRDVRDREVPFPLRKIPELVPGKNTYREGNEIKASCGGRFVCTENSFLVQEILEIEADVDFSTGNLRYGGDLIVRGSIREGFILEIGGSILCNNSLEASKVSAGKDIVVLGRILGKKDGFIKAAGGVKGRFIEHCPIGAGGPVFAEKAILHSVIRTKDTISLGRKGIIIGGRLYAQNGISAGQIGSDIGTKTEIHAGIDPEAERQILWLRDKTVDLQLKLKEIKNSLLSHPDNPGLISLKERITKHLEIIEGKAADIAENLDRNEEAVVTVAGYAFPGVTIEICHTLFVVTSVLKNVEFYLDKTDGLVKNRPVPAREAKT